jgi:hypothetical protein
VATAAALAHNWLAWLAARIERGDRNQAGEVFAWREGRLLMRIVGVESAGDA